MVQQDDGSFLPLYKWAPFVGWLVGQKLAIFCALVYPLATTVESPSHKQYKLHPDEGPDNCENYLTLAQTCFAI